VTYVFHRVVSERQRRQRFFGRKTFRPLLKRSLIDWLLKARIFWSSTTPFWRKKTVVVTEEFLVVRQICFCSNITVFLHEKRMSSKRELFDLLVVDKNFFVTEKNGCYNWIIFSNNVPVWYQLSNRIHYKNKPIANLRVSVACNVMLLMLLCSLCIIGTGSGGAVSGD